MALWSAVYLFLFALQNTKQMGPNEFLAAKVSEEKNADIHRLHTAKRLDGGGTVCRCWEDDSDRNNRVFFTKRPSQRAADYSGSRHAFLSGIREVKTAPSDFV